jgi:subtilisin family serine protease
LPLTTAMQKEPTIQSGRARYTSSGQLLSRLGLTSLLILASACSSAPLSDVGDDDSSAVEKQRPGMKQAPFDQPTTAPSVQKAPLAADRSNYRHGQVIVKLRTPLLQLQNLRDFHAINAQSLAVAARARLPRVAAAGVQLKSAALLHAPRRLPVASGALTATLEPVSTYLFDVDGGNRDMIAVARQLSEEPEVEWAEPNWQRKISAVPNDEHYGLEWHLPAINAPSAWDTTKGAKHIVVAVIDTGVVWDHPDLAANIWSNLREVAGDGLDNDGNGFVDDVRGWDFGVGDADPRDELFHGTHVSGIVGAVGNNGIGVAGVAWNSRIMPVKVADAGGGLFDSAIIAGIHYAVDNGADILNMSFGGPEPSQAVREAIKYAAERDVLPVAAAGNDYGRLVSYPAVHPECVAVAALDESGAVAGYSNFGSFVDIAAPGSNILSTLDGGWGYASGTSMAAPVVAGLAALVKSAHPDFSAQAIRYQLLSTGRDLLAQNGARATQLGSGGADAARAVGPRSAAPWVSLLETGFSEVTGDRDDEFEAGEVVKLAATVGGFADAANVTISVSTASSWLSLTVPAQTKSVPFGGSTTADLRFSVNSGVPVDTVASLTLRVQSGALQRNFPLSVTLRPSFRNRQTLPPRVQSSFQKLPASQMSYVYDDIDYLTHGHWRVLGTIRSASGVFSTPVVLSNPATDAADSHSFADASGNVHVVFRQYDANHDFPVLFYTKYTAASGSWSTAEPITTSADAPNWFSAVAEEPVSVDAQGRAHVVWYDFDRFTGNGQIRTAVRTSGGWVKTVLFDAPGFAEGFSSFVALPNGNLGLFYTLGQGATHQLTEWDGAAWSASRTLDDVTTQSASKVPFRLGDTVYRVQADEGFGQPYRLASLGNDDAWNPLRVITPSVTNNTAHFELAVETLSATDFALIDGSQFLPRKRFIRNVNDVETIREFPLRMNDYAGDPTLATGADNHFHALLLGAIGIWNRYTSYYTTAPIPASARPGIPVVNDGGNSTSSASLTVSWTSTGGAAPAYYRVGVGTAPGGEDIIRFTRYASSPQTLNLGSELEPGRTYYVSVRAVAAGLYESETGSSDGIVYNPTPRCTADPWNASFVYGEAGIQVTHNGNTWRNQYTQSGNVPNSSSGPWTLVGPCSGTPAPTVCEFPAWTNSQNYQAGDVVKHNGREFLALWTSQGQTPTSLSGNAWRAIGVCSN